MSPFWAGLGIKLLGRPILPRNTRNTRKWKGTQYSARQGAGAELWLKSWTPFGQLRNFPAGWGWVLPNAAFATAIKPNRHGIGRNNSIQYLLGA